VDKARKWYRESKSRWTTLSEEDIS
jgi:hypothetical protein